MFAIEVARTAIIPAVIWFKNTALVTNNFTILDLKIQIEELDVYYILKIAAKIQEHFVSEARICLKALIEQFEKLLDWYQTSWVFGSYRVGNISLLARDIFIWNAKLIKRLQFLHFTSLSDPN